MPILVQNSLDLASLMRVRHLQNLKHYLKVFILYIVPFSSLILRVDAKFTTKLEGLNRVFLDVYVLPLADLYLESKKRMHVVNLDYVSECQLNNE